MHVEHLDSDKIICYPLIQGDRINCQHNNRFEITDEVERKVP